VRLKKDVLKKLEIVGGNRSQITSHLKHYLSIYLIVLKLLFFGDAYFLRKDSSVNNNMRACHQFAGSKDKSRFLFWTK
jgi:hypothetical protein